MYYVTDIFLPSRMMRDTVSGLELLGLHSYSPLCLMSTLAMDTVDQDTCSPTWVVTIQLWSWVTGKGWWLKYQKMWWGGSGDNTVQLMECEEPTLRYTDFSPTIAHRGSEVLHCWSCLHYVALDLPRTDRCILWPIWGDVLTWHSYQPESATAAFYTTKYFIPSTTHTELWSNSPQCWGTIVYELEQCPLLSFCLHWTQTDRQRAGQGRTCCGVSPTTP